MSSKPKQPKWYNTPEDAENLSNVGNRGTDIPDPNPSRPDFIKEKDLQGGADAADSDLINESERGETGYSGHGG
ncbi:MAG: hypothetical protein AB1489_00725 [Acidobacteriota bacterium]